MGCDGYVRAGFVIEHLAVLISYLHHFLFNCCQLKCMQIMIFMKAFQCLVFSFRDGARLKLLEDHLRKHSYQHSIRWNLWTNFDESICAGIYYTMTLLLYWWKYLCRHSLCNVCQHIMEGQFMQVLMLLITMMMKRILMVGDDDDDEKNDGDEESWNRQVADMRTWIFPPSKTTCL